MSTTIYCAAAGHETSLSCEGQVPPEFYDWPSPKAIATTRLGGQLEVSGDGTPPGWEGVELDQEDWHSAWREWIRAYENGIAEAKAAQKAAKEAALMQVFEGRLPADFEVNATVGGPWCEGGFRVTVFPRKREDVNLYWSLQGTGVVTYYGHDYPRFSKPVAEQDARHESICSLLRELHTAACAAVN